MSHPGPIAGSGGSDERRWYADRGEVYARLAHLERACGDLVKTLDETREELSESRRSIIASLAHIEGKLALVAFKAGVWATLANALVTLGAVLLIYLRGGS